MPVVESGDAERKNERMGGRRAAGGGGKGGPAPKEIYNFSRYLDIYRSNLTKKLTKKFTKKLKIKYFSI